MPLLPELSILECDVARLDAMCLHFWMLRTGASLPETVRFPQWQWRAEAPTHILRPFSWRGHECPMLLACNALVALLLLAETPRLLALPSHAVAASALVFVSFCSNSSLRCRIAKRAPGSSTCASSKPIKCSAMLLSGISLCSSATALCSPWQ